MAGVLPWRWVCKTDLSVETAGCHSSVLIVDQVKFTKKLGAALGALPGGCCLVARLLDDGAVTIGEFFFHFGNINRHASQNDGDSSRTTPWAV